MLLFLLAVFSGFLGDARRVPVDTSSLRGEDISINERTRLLQADGQTAKYSPAIQTLSNFLFAFNPSLRLQGGRYHKGPITPQNARTGPQEFHYSNRYAPCHRCKRSGARLARIPMQLNETGDGEDAGISKGNVESSSSDSEKLAENRKSLLQKMRVQWAASREDFKHRPISYLMIPIVSAIVGYITNLLGVKMLFYPIHWRGIPLLRYPEQPFGWFGWQGVVPSKRFRMAETMVDVTISKLLDVGEIFKRLDPRQLAKILEPEVRSQVLGGCSLPFINRFFLRRACKGVIDKAPEVVDIRGLVVSGLTADITTLSNFFQNVGRKELSFLVNSGFGVGFVLGLFQMIQWMLYPKGWTLVAGGGVVGYITNWVALKWIFQPLDPMKIGPFLLHGMFLQRQNEVAEEFSEYIAGVTLNSKRVWADVLDGKTTPRFTNIIGSRLPLPRGQVRSLVSYLKSVVGNGKDHPLHDYTQSTLRLRQTLEAKMKGMSSKEFEQVLHPIFQEDELTLILAGAVLGAAAGGLQWWQNDKIDGWVNALQAKFAKWRSRRFGRKANEGMTPDSADNASSILPPSDDHEGS